MPEIFNSGGDRSHRAPRFDLIPREFAECVADRLELGVAQHGEREILALYRRGDAEAKRGILNDADWWIQMECHLHDHVVAVHERDFTQDTLWGHLGAIMWNAGMLA